MSIAQIASVSPPSTQPGFTATMAVTGSGTHFTSGTPVITFTGQNGIIVFSPIAGSIHVVNDTYLTCRVAIPGNAAPGVDPMQVTVGSEVSEFAVYVVSRPVPISAAASIQPPPQQLTTAYPNPTILGGIDGINNTFVIQVWSPQLQVWKNGNLQTQNVDYCFGPTAIVFLPGSIPQPGDLITAQSFGTI